MKLLEPAVFLKQTFREFRTTGAIAPSSSFLARAMVSHLEVRDGMKVLEVGAGTGAFTLAILKRLRGAGTLDATEINPDFAGFLERRLHREAPDCVHTKRVRVLPGDILELNARGQYDAIISGLPFNNFQPAEVQRFLDHFRALAKPNGQLSFFEYAGVRRLQQPFVSAARRQRLREIAHVITRFAEAHHLATQIVWMNVPPARVRHFRFALQ